MAGRGFGKTRLGAEWLASQAIRNDNVRCAIIARTFSDVRNVCVEGVSGILGILREYDALKDWNKSNGIITLKNGSIIQTFSADTPDSLRGPQFHFGWCDELAAWQYDDTWNQFQFGLRLGEHPQTVITTTPRPTKLIKSLLKSDSTVVTRGSSFDNAENLSESALLEMQNRYANTRLGRQELFGEVLDDNPGALWTRARIESARIKSEQLPSLIRVVVGIDPAVTSGDDSDSTGIIVAGIAADNNYYVLADETIKASPQEWATIAATAFDAWKADRIIAEVNNGGDLVLHLLSSVRPNIPVKKVTASRGKAVRAEPISALYEQGRVHHVGYFSELEEQMCEWEPGISTKSPDRMDALVWALTELSEGSASLTSLSSLGKLCPACSFPNIKSAGVCMKCGSIL